MLSNSQKNLLMGGVLIIAAGSVGAFFYLTAPESTESPIGSPTVNTPQSIKPVTGQAGGLTPQPPGQAPPGKVWSAEHGHWHDIQTGAAQPTATASSQPGKLTPQPAGEVPEGKVWSAEHGHWHDAQTVKVINPNEAGSSDDQ